MLAISAQQIERIQTADARGLTVILELKSVENIAQVHRKQLQTYLRLSDKKLGLLLNFGAPLMRDGIVRAVNNLPES
jgi:GxxExxY protein